MKSDVPGVGVAMEGRGDQGNDGDGKYHDEEM